MNTSQLEDHLVICGFNAGVPALLHEIALDQALRTSPVVLVNELPRLPLLADSGVDAERLHHLRGDHARLTVLEHAGVRRAARAVVVADAVRATHDAGDRDARTVLAALTIEKLNPRIHCTVELMDPTNETHLRVAGVEAIVMRNDLSGRMLATACRRPELVSVIMELVTLHRGATIEHAEAPARPIRFDALLEQRKLHDGSLLVAVVRPGKKAVTNPPGDFEVRPGDGLVVITGQP